MIQKKGVQACISPIFLQMKITSPHENSPFNHTLDRSTGNQLSCIVTRALSTRVPALACSALTPMHFPGVHPSRYVYLDLDSGCFYWNRQNALE